MVLNNCYNALIILDLHICYFCNNVILIQLSSGNNLCRK